MSMCNYLGFIIVICLQEGFKAGPFSDCGNTSVISISPAHTFCNNPLNTTRHQFVPGDNIPVMIKPGALGLHCFMARLYVGEQHYIYTTMVQFIS